MKHHHIYRAYGLTIESELELPELIEDNGVPEVSVRFGTAPEMPDANIGRNQRVRATKDELLLMVEDVATYYVEGGNRIIVEPIATGDEAAIRLFLLGSAFGALLQQRGYYVLHGSAVEVNGRAFIFSGTSGAGKSTLSATLSQKGYPLISDDVCAIKIQPGQPPTIVSGFPRIKLCKDAAQLLQKDCDTGLPVRTGFEKYNFSIDDVLMKNEVPLGGIFVIRKSEHEGIRIEPITGLRKISVLVKNTYRIRFVKIRRDEQRMLEQCATLSSRVEVYNLYRGKTGSSAQEIAEYLEKNQCFD